MTVLESRVTDSVAFASVGNGPVEHAFLLLSCPVDDEVSGRRTLCNSDIPQASRGPTCPLSILDPGLYRQGPAFTLKAAVTLCKFRVMAIELLLSFIFNSCTQAR